MTAPAPSPARRMVLTGGGSGGHTMTQVPIITELRRRHPDMDLMYIGSRRGVEREMAERRHVPYIIISTGKLRRYFSLKNVTDIFRIIGGVVKSLIALRLFSPRLVFSTGGFVSVPVCIAARLLRIPVVVHEQTMTVGLANRLASRFAVLVLLAHRQTTQHFPHTQTKVTGQPIRQSVRQGSRSSLKRRFGIRNRLPIIYVTGGAQGARIINETLREILPALRNGANIIHQFGRGDINTGIESFQTLARKRGRGRYIVREFYHEEMGDIYNGADLLIGRSGAGTVADVSAAGLPAIYIPLKIAAGNEQYLNARSVERRGAAVIIQEDTLSPEALQTAISEVLDRKLPALRKAAARHRGQNGTQAIVDALSKTAGFPATSPSKK